MRLSPDSVNRFTIEKRMIGALAGRVCRQRHKRETPCADCYLIGQALAKPVARALISVAQATCHGDYKTQPGEHEAQAIGRGFEVLEMLAKGKDEDSEDVLKQVGQQNEGLSPTVKVAPVRSVRRDGEPAPARVYA